MCKCMCMCTYCRAPGHNGLASPSRPPPLPPSPCRWHSPFPHAPTVPLPPPPPLQLHRAGAWRNELDAIPGSPAFGESCTGAVRRTSVEGLTFAEGHPFAEVHTAIAEVGEEERGGGGGGGGGRLSADGGKAALFEADVGAAIKAVLEGSGGLRSAPPRGSGAAVDLEVEERSLLGEMIKVGVRGGGSRESKGGKP